MILVDTSVWVDHFRIADANLAELLERNLVTLHPWIIGELACGNLKDRTKTLAFLRELPEAIVATSDEVLYYIDRHKLMGKGIGYVDANLLVSAALESHELWTNDFRLLGAAQSLEVPSRTSPRRN